VRNQTPNEARVIPLRRPAGQAAPAAPAASPAPPPPARDPQSPPAKEPLWRDLVGDVLRRERLAQERTLKEVAEAARISMPYLSELERGRKEASSEVLAAAAQALGLGLADLLSLVHGELARHTRPGTATRTKSRTPATRTTTTVTRPARTTSTRQPYDGLCLVA
jgi:transcriptional regulator with XRE-family HTH domain